MYFLIKTNIFIICSFIGIGPGPSKTLFEKSAIRRISIVALGEKDDFTLAVSQVAFY